MNRRSFIISVAMLPFIREKEVFSPEIEITPDYKRELKEIVLILPLDEEIKNNNDIQVFESLISVLPEYTKIKIPYIGNLQDIKTKHSFLSKFDSRIEFFEIKDKGVSQMIFYSDIWAQDYFEKIYIDDQSKILIPNINISNQNNFIRSGLRTKKLQAIFNKKITEAPFYFEGGNLMSDVLDGKQIIFVGYSDLIKNAEYFEYSKKLKSKDALLKAKDSFIKYFSKSSVVFLGEEAQIDPFFHLDQSLIFLGNKKVVVNTFKEEIDPVISRPLDVKGIKKQQEYIIKQLKQLGYQVFEFEMSVADIEDNRNPINAIPFYNKDKKRQEIIFPVYKEFVKPESLNKKIFTKDDLTSSALDFYNLMEKMGYNPKPVFDSGIYKRKGSLHCILNALSLNDLKEIEKNMNFG